MKAIRLSPVVAGLLIFALAGFTSALEPPRIIPSSGRAPQPPSQVFKTLKTYFSDLSLSKFHVTQASEAAEVIVAQQSGVDTVRWRQWAACQTDPMHMLYQFQDGTVTVKVTLDPSPGNATFVTVSADFQGTYGLGQDTTTIACRSTGTLEQEILRVAGVPQSGN